MRLGRAGGTERPAGARPPVQRARLARLAALYVGFLAVVIVGVLLLIGRGQRDHAQPPIAGGYDVQQGGGGCLGAPTSAGIPVGFDVQQSGEFVAISNQAGTLGGSLRLHAAAAPTGRLSGTIKCVDGTSRDFRGIVRSAPPVQLSGTIGGVPVQAVFKRDPPDPGAPLAYTPGSIAGDYRLVPRSDCLGGAIKLSGQGTRYSVAAGSKHLGAVAYNTKNGAITGAVSCLRGGTAALRATAGGTALTNLLLTPAAIGRAGGAAPPSEKLTATRVRPFDHLVGSFFIAVAIVMLLARLFGILAERVRQPRVMGEVVAGLTLGPSVLGAISPQLQGQLFPSDILPAFGIAANLGLIFYMFLIGLEVDRSQLRGRIGHAVAISNASVALPMLLGIALAIPIYKVLGPMTKFAAFALFLGVAMSITAFPVLARILAERRMLKRPLGALVITCASIDDVVAWFLIALATAVASHGGFGEVAKTIALAVAFCVVMGVAVRPLIGRVSGAYDQSGRVPPGWVAIIFGGILLSAWVTDIIGIAVIFGGFVMGMTMPRNAGLTEDVTRRVEDFVVTLLLPMFFAYTGLQLNVGQLNNPVLWLITLALIGVAIVGKLVGAMGAARIGGIGWRESAVIGTLMNTRGLTELIVLNLALQKGVISSALFTMMVLMALITTFMAGPILKLLDPHNRLGAPVEEELIESRERSLAAFPTLTLPERSILVAAQHAAAVAPLRELAEPLARSEPPRELILVRLIRPPRGAEIRGGLQTENALVRQAEEGLDELQEELVQSGVAARTIAFSSTHPGEDVARLAESEEIDLLLIDGRRPLLREALPLVDIRPVLEQVTCDVGILVAREGARLHLGPGAPVLVPFGGAEHDWSALELGAWLASANDAPLKLLGAAGTSDESPAIKRRLDDAGLLVRDFSGVSTDSIVVEDGRQGILQASRTARLLVVGVSERWKQEGLGDARSYLARSSEIPVLFVRRGQKVGALAPRDNFTRFSWSSAGRVGGSSGGVSSGSPGSVGSGGPAGSVS